MSDLVQPSAALQEFLGVLAADTGSFTGGMVLELFQNNNTPTINSALSDFTICDFVGYVSTHTLAWGSVGVDSVGNAQMIAGSVTFTASDGTKPQQAYGYLVRDSGATKLFWAQLFDTPMPFTAAGQQGVVVPTYTFQSSTS